VEISIRYRYVQCLRCYFRESSVHSRVAASTEWCNFGGKLLFSLRSDQLTQVAPSCRVFSCLPPTVPALSAGIRPKSNRSAVVVGSVRFAIVVLTNAPHVCAPVYHLKTWARRAICTPVAATMWQARAAIRISHGVRWMAFDAILFARHVFRRIQASQSLAAETDRSVCSLLAHCQLTYSTCVHRAGDDVLSTYRPLKTTVNGNDFCEKLHCVTVLCDMYDSRS